MTVQNCGQFVTKIVSGRVYNVNSCILNVHLAAAVEITNESSDSRVQTLEARLHPVIASAQTLN